VVRGGVATLDYAIYATGVEASDQIYDGALAISSNALRTLCGPDWHPTEVLFCHSKPADASPFRRVFDGPLRFDAEQTAIVFPVTWLAHRLCGADSAVYRRLERRVGALKEQADDDPVAALRRLLRTLLLGGSGSVANVAKHLAMHRRTLNRRLEARGTSVHELVEEIRFEVARQLVELTRMPLVEISAALGYADPSAFTRAFRRWSGITPSEWRASRSRGGANQRGPGPPAQAPAARAPARRPKKLPSASEMPLL
jgi:AraC-like DNA-binding protein